MARAPLIIGEPSYFPEEKTEVTGRVVRSICLLNHPVPGEWGDITVVRM